MIETALWGLSMLITAAVCFWVGVGVGRGEGVSRDRGMEICNTCPGRREKYRRSNAGSRL